MLVGWWMVSAADLHRVASRSGTKNPKLFDPVAYLK